MLNELVQDILADFTDEEGDPRGHRGGAGHGRA